MKVILTICKNNPANVEEIVLEDVAEYTVTDTKVRVTFNGSEPEEFLLLNDEKQTRGEWFYLDIHATRIPLKIDMSK